jgi:hypothetical protein
MSATAPNKPTIGLPPEQLQQWLVWVREDLDRVTERVDYMLGEQARLTAQERLLGQLLETVAISSNGSSPHEAAEEPEAAERQRTEDVVPDEAVTGDEVVEAPADAEAVADPQADDSEELSETQTGEACAPPMPSFTQPWMTHPLS